MKNSKKQRKLTLDFKIGIMEKLKSGMSTSKICKIHSLPSSTVSMIWNDREKILQEKEQTFIFEYFRLQP